LISGCNSAKRWQVRLDVKWWANGQSDSFVYWDGHKVLLKDEKAEQEIILVETDPGAVITEQVLSSVEQPLVSREA